jgi:hypothetical protein
VVVSGGAAARLPSVDAAILFYLDMQGELPDAP